MFVLAENATLGDKLLMGGKVTLLGLGTVFAILAFLYFILVLFRIVFAKKSSGNPVDDASAPVTAAVSPVSDLSDEPVEVEDDEEIAAAVIAAISASTGKAPGAFRVISLKKRS